MCWNASVSLNTYIFGLFASLFSYYNGFWNILSVILYQSFIIIQLIEYFIWTKTFSNKLLSQIALFVILCQPIFNIIKIETYPKAIPYLLVAYLIFIIILYTLIIPIDTINFSTVPSKNGHLSWPWLKYSSPNFYLILLAINIFYLSKFNYSLLFFIITYIFLCISAKYFYYNSGELWCFFGSFIPLILYFLSFHLDIFEKIKL